MVSELLRKYIWIVQTFKNAGRAGLSLEEVIGRWESRFGSPYSRRTFNNHRQAVEEVFGVRIECDRTNNRYYAQTGDDTEDENSAIDWMINTFTVSNVLNMSKERLSGRVSIENIPSGRKYLTKIMEAMAENCIIRIMYQKYSDAEGEVRTVLPYAVKEFEKRWYLVGWCREKSGKRVFALDRVKGMEVHQEHFAMPDGFDVDEEFATSFGPYLPDGEKARTITFKVMGREAKYLIDLPLHPTQKVVSIDGNFTTFSIFVCPNDALIMEFCRRGGRLEVLSPAEVREAVAQEVGKAMAKYLKQ